MNYTVDTSTSEYVVVDASAESFSTVLANNCLYELVSTSAAYVKQGSSYLITCLAKASLVDGEYITISGIGIKTKTYEFDVDGGGLVAATQGSTPNTLISISGEVTVAEVADRLALAIAAGHPTLVVAHNYAAQVIADTVFTAATSDILTAAAHGMLTGDGPVRVSTDTTLPGGLAAVTDYWVIKLSANTFSLASTLANAYLGVAVDITSTGAGVQTLADVGGTVRSAGTVTVTAASQFMTVTEAVANGSFTVAVAALTPSLADGSALVAPNVPVMVDGRNGSQLAIVRATADGSCTLSAIQRI